MSIWDKITKKNRNEIVFNDDDIRELKNEYNRNLKRLYKAEEYYKLPTTTEEEFNRTFYAENGYLKIVQNLSFLMQQYRFMTNSEMTEEEKLKGFNL